MSMKILIAGAGLAALAAAPAAAQYGTYYPPYGGNYGAPYGNAYGYYNNYNNAGAEQMAAQRCAAEVEMRLHRGTNVGGILASLLGARVAPSGRVLSVNNVRSGSLTMRVRGIADSGRMAYNGYGNGYGSYGYGAYGALGYNYASVGDLAFKCDVDYQGRIRDVDITRRR
jgi:hypothetical protein